MSNLFLNISFKSWHLQWARGKWLPVVSYNSYWDATEQKPPFFAVHKLFGYTGN